MYDSASYFNKSAFLNLVKETRNLSLDLGDAVWNDDEQLTAVFSVPSI